MRQNKGESRVPDEREIGVANFKNGYKVYKREKERHCIPKSKRSVYENKAYNTKAMAQRDSDVKFDITSIITLVYDLASVIEISC